MANSKSGGQQKKTSLIDPIYQKFTKSVIRALGNTDFYEFFMASLAQAENVIQFSNRKTIKTVDLQWVDAIEESLKAFQSIIANPRNVIKEEELVVNVANAKKAGSDVVRHLAQHASLVEDFDEERGNVRPSRLMQKYREDSTGLYENRLVYTTMENAYQFVKIRHDALFSAMSDEYGAKLKLDSNMETATEQVRMEMFLHIKEIDGALETDEKNRDVFGRISMLYRVLGVLMSSPFAQALAKLPRVRGTITKTNVLKKNPEYKKIVKLYEFLQGYTDIGYTIRVVEQNPAVNETFQQDIFHNIMFNYLVLKGYLEDEADRRVPATQNKGRKRALKPKFIKEIIEELTEDYDLPDVEIRKVLIEELTKEQLMQEEAAERQRLVAEQAQRKKEEQERIRKEKEAEKERIRKEKEAEAERLRLEKEAEQQRILQQKMEQEAEDRRRCKLFQEELERFRENLDAQLDARVKAAEKKAAELRAFEEALRKQEEAERRKKEEEERRLQQQKEAQERREREAAEREERKRIEAEQKEAERQARLAEQLRLKREEEERQERIRIAEEQLREQLRLEAEARLAEQRRLEAEALELERRRQEEEDVAGTQIYVQELTMFIQALPKHLAERAEETQRYHQEKEQWEQDRQRRRAARFALFKR